MRETKVIWNCVLYGNVARPRVVMSFWLACLWRLPTKFRLCRFGLIDINICCFYPHEETMDHLFYGCRESKAILIKFLGWIQVDHDPKEWWKELGWIVSRSNRKGWRASILNLVVVETIYDIWR